jgi:hypothetical protein
MPGDLSRSDPLLQQCRLGRSGIVLGGDPLDPQLLGVRITDLPAGRGYLVRRNQRNLTQIAYLEPEKKAQWVRRFSQVVIARETRDKAVPPAASEKESLVLR